MTNNLTINTTSLSSYGAYLLQGSLADLVQWPSTKSINTIDYAEEDGLEADLTDLKLDAKKVSLQMHFKSVDRMNAFLSDIQSSTYNNYTFSALGRTYTMRYLSHSANWLGDGFINLTLNLSEDAPSLASTRVLPTSYVTIPSADDYLLDGESFTKYNVIMLQGTYKNTLVEGGMKNDMEVNISTVNGVEVSRQNKKKNRDVTLKCFLRHKTIANALNALDALLFDLCTPSSSGGTSACLHQVTVRRDSRVLQCYYKSMEVVNFFIDDGKIWLEFDMKVGVIK